MDGPEWITQFAAALGTAPPDPAEIDALLALAGVAAHASERTAAPISCWIAARAGAAPADALAAARELAATPSDDPTPARPTPDSGVRDA